MYKEKYFKGMRTEPNPLFGKEYIRLHLHKQEPGEREVLSEFNFA